MTEANKDPAKLSLDFASLGLDPRLTRALAKAEIVKPTLIQEKAIPLALAGKDILARARTGSGKTLAYLLPVIHRILEHSENVKGTDVGTMSLILVPTRELARQVTDTASSLLRYVAAQLGVYNVAGEENISEQKSILLSENNAPSIVVSTPSRLLPFLDLFAPKLSSTLQMLVVDEADLVLGFGYGDDLEKILAKLPKLLQCWLMSATMSPDVAALKSLLLHNPAILRLEDGDGNNPEGDGATLQQYTINCGTDTDKHLLIYVILKLRLLKGKILIFSNEVDRAYKLKLFLEQFGLKAAILNSELPLATRYHLVEEFNRGVYDIVIASDLQDDKTGSAKRDMAGNSRKKSKDKKEDANANDALEYSAARGVDFKRVDVVINFDFPLNLETYIHRVGRTARGGHSGTALSLVTPSDSPALSQITADQLAHENVIVPYEFEMSRIEPFRYRCLDAIRAVTRAAIRDARLKELKNALLTSEKLKTFFEERPKDAHLLRHDTISFNIIKAPSHMKHVPEYLMKKIKGSGNVRSTNDSEEAITKLPQQPLHQSNRSVKKTSQGEKAKHLNKRKSRDPLKSFKGKK